MALWRTTQALLLTLLVWALAACGGSAQDTAATPAYGPAGYPEMAGGMAMPAEPAPMREAEEVAPSDDAMDYAKQAPPPPPMAPAPPGEKPKPGQQGAGADSKRSPILIYTADYTMSVFEVQKSLDAVEGIAKAAGGYLARRDDTTITVRVPAEKFQQVIADVEKVGDVTHRNVVSEDVTAEYRDLEIQLQNQLALRLRFEKLLEKANKVEEALQIEKELGRITGEIERIKGRLKLLTDLAQFSTITVSFQARVSQSVQQGPFVLPLPWLGNLGLNRLMNLQ
ncbi:MAG: DUF4349 domain-containing protein [Myxococcales bacterium]|nr:DUF4349 domain-containing protein [Myxococcales bacterium]